MRTAFLFFVGNLPSLMCVIAAFYLAACGLAGWGWFLFVAVILSASVKAGKGGDT